MRESIFFASVRSFFIGLFGMTGIIIGILLAFTLVGLLFGTASSDPDTIYNPEIIANGSGVRKTLSKDAPVILRLDVVGAIGIESLDMQSFRQQLIESREGILANDRVKALLLYIESPGGTVVDSDGIYRAVKAYKEKYKVPVYAYIDGLCASGGMYIACSADKILASDVSVVGSVGVLTSPFFNIYKLMEKVGIDALTLTAGKGKDELNPTRPWRTNEDANLKALIDYYYNDFVNIVTSNRPKLDKTKLVQDYGAQIFPAKTAEEYGYIDQSGISYEDTLKLLAEKIGIQDDYYQVMQMTKPWYMGIFKSDLSLFKGVVKHQIELSPEMNPRLSNQFLYLYSPGAF